MATNTERTLDAQDKRLTAVEERVNEIQDLMKNAVNQRSLNAAIVALGDEIETLRGEVAANTAILEQIKQRLNLS